MSRAILIVLTAFAIAISTPTATAGQSEVTDAQVQQWIGELYGEDSASRKKAFDALAGAGLKAEIALEREKDSTEDPDIKLCINRLLAIPRDDAFDWTWLGTKYGSVFGADLTAAGAVSVRTEEKANDPPAEAILQWLASAQEEDGHWDSRKHGAAKEADLEQTSWALLAILSSGSSEKVGPHRANVRRAVAWLISRQRADGAIAPADANEINGLSHALAGLALAEAGGMANVPSTKNAAQKAVEYSVSRHLTPKSGFGIQPRSSSPDLFTTMFFVMQLRSCKVAGLKVDRDAFDSIIAFIESLETLDGFRLEKERPVSIQATAMGCYSKLMLGWKADDLRPMLRLVARRGQPQGRAQPDDLLTYFSLVCSLYDKDGWRELYDGVRNDYLSRTQNQRILPSGHWHSGGAVLANALCEINLACRIRWFLKP